MSGRGLLKLNLGCGRDIRQGWINLDKIQYPGVDIVFDLDTFPYPFCDNTFDAILMQDVLEHLRDPITVMREIYRISKDGCIIIIRTPHPKSPLMTQDKTHISKLEPKFFTNFNVFPAEVLYYHCHVGKLFGILPVKRYWNQLAIIRVIKDE